MKRNIFFEAKISLYVLSAIVFLAMAFYLVATMFTSMGYKGKGRETNTTFDNNNVVIVIDAGHGGEDPGAIDNGLVEKDLNLDVALKVNKMLRASGYSTAMTRREDVLLYRAGEEAQKKHYDLKNRKIFAESYENAVFVSVHMNKFPIEYCSGLQTFYSSNNAMSEALARSIQESAKLLQNENKRVIKDGTDNIYLLSNLRIPAVLIECGFVSNTEEAELLSDEKYREVLAFSIYCGIVNYLEVEQ